MRRIIYDGYFENEELDRWIVVLILRKCLCLMYGYYKWCDEDEVQRVPFKEDGENQKYYVDGEMK